MAQTLTFSGYEWSEVYYFDGPEISQQDWEKLINKIRRQIQQDTLPEKHGLSWNHKVVKKMILDELQKSGYQEIQRQAEYEIGGCDRPFDKSMSIANDKI